MTTVSGTYTRPDGTPDRGRVTFTLIPAAIDTAGEQRTPGTDVAVLDSDGAFSIDLVPNSDLINLVDGSAVYEVRETVGSLDRCWNLIVADDSPVDLPSRYEDVPGWDGAVLPVGGAVPLNMLTDVDVPDPVDGERLSYQSSTDTWISSQSASALGFVTMSYRFTTTPPPGAQRVARNNTDPTLATLLWFHQTAQNNADQSLFFENMRAGDWLNLYDPADSLTHESYDLTGTPTLADEVWEVPVVSFDQVGALHSNNQILRVLWRLGGTRPD